MNPESLLMLTAATLLVTGFGIGWFCYSKASPDAVEGSTYDIPPFSHTFSFTNIWLWGAFVGLIIMLVGMLALFVSLAGVSKVKEMIDWYQTIFG